MTEKPRETQAELHVVELKEKVNNSSLMKHRLAPGVYFRLLLVGYFEGIGSERGIAWRAADSLALREFLGLKLSESPSDHSTISRTRRLIDEVAPVSRAAWRFI